MVRSALLTLALAAASIASASPPIEWSRQFGTPQEDRVWSIDVDALGNAILGGYTKGAIIGTHQDSMGDAYVAKLSSDGSLLWQTQFGGGLSDSVSSVETDSAGNIFVGGSSLFALTGDDSSGFPFSASPFVRKYDANGQVIWTTEFTVDDTHVPPSLINMFAAKSGAIYATGINVVSTPFVNQIDGMLNKFDANGNQLWTRSFTTPDGVADDWVFDTHVVSDAVGNAYVAGTARMFGTSSTSDVFLMKFDDAGNQVWTQQLRTVPHEAVGGMAIDDHGNIYIGGSAANSSDATAPTNNDLFISRWTLDGELQWAHQFPAETNEFITSLSIVPGGGVFFGGGVSDEEYEFDALVGKISETGEMNWMQRVDSDGDLTTRVASDNLSRLYFTTSTSNDLGGMNAGVWDMYVAKFANVPEPTTLSFALAAAVSFSSRRRRIRFDTDVSLLDCFGGHNASIIAGSAA